MREMEPVVNVALSIVRFLFRGKYEGDNEPNYNASDR